MTKALVLWDVDNTLIANGGVSKDNYRAAFTLLTGLPCEHRPVTGGRTDPLILDDLLRAHGVEVSEAVTARFPEVLEQAMTANRDALARRGRELPGARAALAAVAEMPEVVQSVLTGNIRPNGFTKVDVFGLAEPLDWEVGGYGSDSSVRSELVAVAQKRASAKYGEPFDSANTVLVGDTPNDVRAGLNGGARVLAVASGSDSAEALHQAGADIVLADLTATEDFLKALELLLRGR